MLKDVMPHFELFQPATLDDAVALAERFGDEGWLLAGGQDSLDWFKDRARRPRAVIDLSAIPELHGIRERDGGLEIGALTTLAEIERSPLVRERFEVLADAVRSVASPQIRNVATLGGNLCQDTRCWYYRAGHTCYRAGGNTCYADTPRGMNREHAIFGANRCVAVSPSDAAPALVALDAEVEVRDGAGTRSIPVEELFMGPAIDITRMTVLEPGQIVTSVHVPATWAGAEFRFEKVADRRTWDFALVSIASALRMDGDRIGDVRMVCGGVACTPHRLREAEDYARGEPRDDATEENAARNAAQGARPLNFNHFKVPLVQNLVRRVIRGA